MRVNLIVATDARGGVARRGRPPWDSNPLAGEAAEMYARRYDQLTIAPRHAVVMGRRAWDALPEHPLPRRLNIVITTGDPRLEGAIVVASAQEACAEAKSRNIDTLWVVGGVQTFKAFEALGVVSEVFHTTFESDFKCDVFYRPDAGELEEEETLVGADPSRISAVQRRSRGRSVASS